MNCNSFKFSYLTNTIALRASDQSNILMNNFPNVVNGATTSDDYLSVSTKNYNDSPYIVIATITVNLPD